MKILEEGEYITKRRNEQNNREVFVELTQYSKNKVDQCVKETDVRTLIDEEFTDDDFKQLGILLNKFNNNIK